MSVIGVHRSCVSRTMGSAALCLRSGMGLLAITVVLFAAAGCAGQRASGPYSPMTPGTRDTAKATRLNAEAAELLNRAATNNDPGAGKKAEVLLREALDADLYYGPAHNNLGVIFLGRDQLYEAAAEFEWARKLMPGHPDPRVNLAFTLESAGRVDDAIATYRTALEVLPDDIAAMQGLARLQTRSGKRDEHTANLLSEIAMRGETPAWREWAQAEQRKMPVSR